MTRLILINIISRPPVGGFFMLFLNLSAHIMFFADACRERQKLISLLKYLLSIVTSKAKKLNKAEKFFFHLFSFSAFHFFFVPLQMKWRKT